MKSSDVSSLLLREDHGQAKKEKKHELIQKYVDRLEQSVPFQSPSSRNQQRRGSAKEEPSDEPKDRPSEVESKMASSKKESSQKKKKDPQREFQFSEVSRYMRTFGENLTTKEIDDMLNEPTFERSMFSGSIEKKDERLVTYDEFFKMLTSS